MSGCSWWWASLALASLAAAQNPGRVEVAVDMAASAYVQEPVPVALRIRYDATWFAEHAVALFRQQTDVPFHVDVSWLRAAPERAVTAAAAASGDGARVAVGDRILRGRLVTAAAGELSELTLDLRWLPLAAGEADVAPVTVRYAYATQFREHLLRGREPVDRQEARVTSDGRTLAVEALPKPVPEGFFGAVGSFAATASADRDAVTVGDSLRLEVVLTGDGNLARFARPAPPVLAGFHVDGVVTQMRDGARVLQLDVLALRPGVGELPSWPLTVFSPRAAAYVELRVPAVPLRVEPAAAGAEFAPRVRDLIAADVAARTSTTPRWLWQLGFVLLAVVGILLFKRGRAGKGRRARHDALHELRMAATQSEDAERIAAAFERVLALAAGGAAFVESTCFAALRERGLPVDEVERLQALRTRLDAARFGGELPAKEDVVLAAQRCVDAIG